MNTVRRTALRNLSLKTKIGIAMTCLILIISVYICFFRKKAIRNQVHYQWSTMIRDNVRHGESGRFVNSRLVWPEELTDGDRIVEQLSYVPKGYEYDRTPIKRILVQFGSEPDTGPLPRLELAEFVGCPVSQCWLTTDASLGPNVDAVLFRQNYYRPKFVRPPGQIWIIHYTDSPYTTPELIDPDVFNWTANYRWDSDIPDPYGYFMKYRPPLPLMTQKRNFEKNKLVAWFVSNCEPNSKSMIYVDELSKHIPIDIYGECGELKCPKTDQNGCFQMLANDYKFYLSFENAHCVNYITDKFFINALKNYVVPIVLGPSRKDYELVAPNNSFIHVDDFDTPKDLADYLKKVDNNNLMYNSYFDWHDYGSIVTDTRFYCRLCAMLHDEERTPMYYANITDWWRGPGVCHQ